MSEEVIVNGNGMLANAFVWVKQGVPEGKWAVSSKQLVCRPTGLHVHAARVGVMIGQPVEFRNSDETNHDIHPLPTEPRMERIPAAQRRSQDQDLRSRRGHDPGEVQHHIPGCAPTSVSYAIRSSP